ncbi:Protein FAM70A [Salix suchowensis]|nr:Protein FAM70A [Salix suchowensis]
MGWLQSLLSPLKNMWFRLHSTPKKSMFFTPLTAYLFYILYGDIKSCQYEDVHVESYTPSLPSKQ